MSDGGFCFLTTQAPKQSALLQGQLRLAQMPVSSPLDRPSVSGAIPYRPQIRYLKRERPDGARLHLAGVIRQFKTTTEY